MKKPILDSVVLSAWLTVGTLAGQARAAPVTPSGNSAMPTDTDTAEQASAELVEHHRHHHHGGVTKFVALSLDTLGVPPAKQAKVDKVQQALYACMIPARDLESGLLLELADGIANGSINTLKVDAILGPLDGAATSIHACSFKSLDQLHALLSPAERSSLADKVQAHWDVWRRVNSDAEAGGREKGGRLEVLAREVALTPDQVEKMSAALQTGLAPLTGQFDAKQVDAHVQAFRSAFEQRSFSGKSLTANANGHIATYGAKRMALFYETVTPLLTAEQRNTVAHDLREHAGQQLATSDK
jgi:hypothetical protein